MRRLLMVALLILICASLIAMPAFAAGAKKGKKAKKKKKGAEEAPPPVGEVVVGKMICYAPPDFAALSSSKRRMARAAALEYLVDLVNGKKMEGFKIKDLEDLEFFETAFLGRPELLDTWLSDNFERCTNAATGKSNPTKYLDYLSKIGRELEAGQCYKPLAYEYHNFLDIQASWQFRLHICKGNEIDIESTGDDNGQYTIADSGDMRNNVFMTAVGDPEVPEAGDAGVVPELPHGALVMRFEAEDGSYTKYFAPGQGMHFVAPDHGYISFTINDISYFDNKFRDIKGAIDYLSVDIYPGGGAEGTAQEGLMP